LTCNKGTYCSETAKYLALAVAGKVQKETEVDNLTVCGVVVIASCVFASRANGSFEVHSYT